MILTVNPFKDAYISSQIRLLQNGLYDHLSKYRGQEPSKEDLKDTQKTVQDLMYKQLLDIGKYSFDQGCREVGITLPPHDTHLYTLIQDCRSRAIFSAESITKTTGLAFGVVYAALSKKKATSKDRSKSVANYEGPKIFFEQRTKAWRLKAGVLKAWYTGSDNPCPKCEDNEDDGKIPIDQPFTSGDIAPPGHIGCECLLSLIL